MNTTQLSVMLTLALCSASVACHRDTSDQSNGSPNSATSEIWEGKCSDSEMPLRLELVSRELWTLKNPQLDKSLVESGKYQVNESDAQFFDGTHKNVIMTCKPGESASQVACELEPANVVGALSNCNVATLSLVSSPSKSDGDKDGSASLVIPEPVKLKKVETRFKAKGICNGREFALNIHEDGLFQVYAPGKDPETSKLPDPSVVAKNQGQGLLAVDVKGSAFYSNSKGSKGAKGDEKAVGLYDAVVDDQPSHPDSPALLCRMDEQLTADSTLKCDIASNTLSHQVGCPSLEFKGE